MPKMNLQDLEALLQRQQDAAIGGLNGTIGNQRANLMRRYLGLKYGDEVEGRSTVVDTSIRDTIESIKPEIMDIFMGGDRVVEFVPRGEEDTEAAEQETDVCNYIFLQENDGFMVLYNWITDALHQKNGYVKRFWDEQKRVEVEEYDELTPDEAAVLLAELEATSDKIEVLEKSGGIDEETGEVSPLYIKIRRTDSEKRYRVVSVPPEELLIHPLWTRVDFKECPFVAHKRAATVSELIAMGFDRKEVEELPEYDRKLESEEAITRYTDQGPHEGDYGIRDGSMREVLVYENYILADYDGDGIAEQLCVFTGNRGKVLKRNRKPAVDFVTDVPFEALSPLPIPHRHFGLSIAELVEDLQRIKTVLSRQLVDNIVGANNPDVVIDEDSMTDNTAIDLSFNGIGRNIRIPGGVGSLQYLPTPQTAGESLAAIQYVDQLKEARTGVTKFNQGLDADALNTTWRGTKAMLSQAQKKVLMIARIFAETGYKNLFVNMHRDLRAGPMKAISTKLNNEYVEVNPRTWRHRTDVTVSVGLGTGDRDVQLARLATILEKQEQGFAQGIIPYEKVHHTLGKMLELSGFKDVDNFLPSPDEVNEMIANRPEQTDMAEVMAQIEGLKVQNQAQEAQAKLMLQKQQQDMDAAFRAQQTQLEQTKADNAKLKTLLDDDRQRDIAAAEMGIKRASLSFDEQRATDETRARLAEIDVRDMDVAKEKASDMIQQAMAGVLEEVRQGHQQLAQMIQQGNQQVVDSLDAEKEIVFNDEGRPIGSRSKKASQPIQ